MKKYGDLRDYHNKKITNNNLEYIYDAIISITIYDILLNIDSFYAGSFFTFTSFRLSSKRKNINKKKILEKRKRLYNEIINKVAFILKNNNINEPIEIMNYLHNAIEKGYLSYDRKFEKINPHETKLEYSSYLVILGQGVCRNINTFTTDVLKKLNIEAYDLFCASKENTKDLNHMITLVIYNNKYYYLDTANNVAYNCINYILSYDSKELFTILNYSTPTYHQISRLYLLYIFNYYKNKRNKDELKKCLFSNLQDSKINYKKNTDQIYITKDLYKENRKLYKEFKKTYL